MRKSIFLWGLLCAFAVSLSSCSDDDASDNGPVIEPEPPVIGSDSNATVEWTSEKGPQSGQKHRSSSNNDLRKLGSDVRFIIWSAPEGVSFKVMQDKTGNDPTLVKYCYNNCVTENFNVGNVYIADPDGASSSFKVKATGFNPPEGAVLATVNNGPMPGQKNRCSENFDLIRDNARFDVVCPDDVTFDIWHDVSGGGADTKKYFNLKNGSIIYAPEDTKLYVVNTRSTKGGSLTHPFPVMFSSHNPAWMAAIPSSTPLTQLSIPGTHDTGTYSETGMAGCQNFNVPYQLNAGLRYFDVRPDKNGRIWHGPTSTDCTMEMVMDACKEFLAKHPTETVILQLNASSGDDICNYVTNLLERSAYKNIVDTSSKLKTLGEYRGKIVIFRRFPLTNGTTSYGIDLTQWPDDCADEFTTPAGDKVYVQDRFYSADEAIHDTKEKSRLVREGIKHAGANLNQLHINFNSVAGRVVSTPWNYAWGTGSDIDPRMSESLAYTLNRYRKENPDSRSVGIILLDYFNAHGYDDEYHLVETIINFNLKDEQFPLSQLNPALDVDNLLKNQPSWW